jgi:glutamate formiminotransferase/formiminotetrahydrofolate cyclodeaminase
LPRQSEAEQAERHRAIQSATREAIEVPLRVMRRSLDGFEVIKAMVDQGLPASISDAAVAALAARSAVVGAGLNVRANLKEIEDRTWAAEARAEAKQLEDAAIAAEREILETVWERMSS